MPAVYKLGAVEQRQYFDDNGLVLAGGFIYTYLANTTTPEDTFSDAAGSTNTNPVELDESGRADVWLDTSKAYKFVVKDADLNTLYTVDEISNLIDSEQIVDGSITEDKLADDAVTEDKLADDAVSTNKIQNSGVTTAKILDSAVTAGKIGADAVTTTKILDAAVTFVKRLVRAVGTSSTTVGKLVISGSCGDFTGKTNTSFADVTNLNISVPTNGGPVRLTLVPDGQSGAANYAKIGVNGSGGGPALEFTCVETGSTYIQGYTGANMAWLPAPVIDTSVAGTPGTYTFKVKALLLGAATDYGLTNLKLIGEEIG